MTNPDPELAATLDAEYRELVRSLHRETIDIVIAVENWWTGHYFRVTVSAGGGFDLDERDTGLAEQADPAWRELHTKLMILINGHPDPDVREAADVLNKRTFETVMICKHSKKRNEAQADQNGLAVDLINKGIVELRRAAYHAPFRVHRPEPEWDGVPTGNAEGLPGDILKQMQERGKNWKG